MRPVSRWLPWTVAAVSVVLLGIAAVVGLTTDSSLHLNGFRASDSGWWVAFLMMSVVGAVVASRRPENPVGWLMLAGGAVNAVAQFAGAYAVWGLVRHPGSLPGAAVAAWLSAFLWEPAIAILVGVSAYFPTGRLLSRRWRWLPVTVTVASATIIVTSAVGLWSMRGRELIAENADVALHTYVKAVIGAVYPIVLICAVAAMVSIVLRYRRARGVERLQMKWLMWAAVVTAPGVIAGEVVTGTGDAAGVVQLINSPAWFTIAAALAILRYRLYDIDRIVSRTVSYIAVTGMVIGVYVGLVALIETGLGFSGSVAVAASTLAAAAAFQPLRSRVQRAVDRRFDRAAYDARRTAEAFAQRLRDEVDVDTISTHLVTTVDAAVAPTAVSLWLART